MFDGKSFLCVIPARGGSKGIPRKNLQPVSGLPLLAWICRAARSSEIPDRVVCSTDDPEIADLALAEGVDVPFMRPAALSDDCSLVVDVLVDTLRRIEKDDGKAYDYVLLLQPTSPFVTGDHIRQVAELAVSQHADTVITGYPVEQMHPQIMFTLDGSHEVHWFCDSAERMTRRQDLPKLYARSGLVYLITRRTLLEKNSIYGDRIMAATIEPEIALSIDTPMDLQIAEWVSASHRPALPASASAQSGNTSSEFLESEQAFETAWRVRPEKGYVHWTRGVPKNQVQLAFRNHWDLFCEIMGRRIGDGLHSLEVGCGRGSLSCYFADAGYDATLLDYSFSVLRSAQEIYATEGLRACFCQGDARALPFDDKTFDVVFSIGLLEHFEQIEPVLAEQVRVLRPGGYLFVYAVPEKPVKVQKEFEWINDLLKALEPSVQRDNKPPLYRNAIPSKPYKNALSGMGLHDVRSAGVYPLPMISTSPEFPFTVMPPECERILVERFNEILEERHARTGVHPWLCEEDYGHAFLVWGTR